jgi:hypothetical protein
MEHWRKRLSRRNQPVLYRAGRGAIMLMWIFFWWLLGVLILFAATVIEGAHSGDTKITLSDALGIVVSAPFWPVAFIVWASEGLLDVPVFDLEWFRRDRDE